MSAVLRASEIPCMVDVEGHIDENLTRWGQGCYVRAAAEVLEPRWEDEQDGDEWLYQRDAYRYWAADEWKPQPPKALEPWELDLYGIAPPPLSRLYDFGGNCGCLLCRTGTTSRFRVTTLSPIFDEMRGALDRLNRQMTMTFGSWTPTFDSRTILSQWAEPEPAPKPVTCPDLARADLPPGPPDRFALDRLTRPPEPPVMRIDTARGRAVDGRNTGPDRQPFRRRGRT